MKSITSIGKQLLAREWADKIILEIRGNPHIDLLELRARGKYTARAVDVCEILKRELNLSKSAITTDTKTLESREGANIKISEIQIMLEKNER